MADVAWGSFSSSISKCYFPTIPPSAPRAAMSYSRAVQEAPHTALMGVIVDGRQPSRHPVTPRCRMRQQVGNTNRWRLPDSLGSDLLGTAQAYKATNISYNPSIIRVITAENPRNTVNLDMDMPYTYRVNDDRPRTCPEPSIKSMSRSSSPLKYSTISPMPLVLPGTAKPAQPIEIFQYHSKKSGSNSGPDVLLQCLGINWELHRPYLQKATLLSELLAKAGEPAPKRFYRNKVSETLDNYISKNDQYSTEYQEVSARLHTVDIDATEDNGIDHPKHVSEQRTGNRTVLTLDISDQFVTPHALAVALGNLYHEHTEVEEEELVGVLAAAHAIGFTDLQNGCIRLMLQTIKSKSVCDYHKVAEKYHQDQMKVACERWLELNLLRELSHRIQLRSVPMDLLQKILKSNKLFVTNEFALYRVVALWMFLQMNQSVQLMPSYSTIMTYFNSLPKAESLIESNLGQHFASILTSLRLHGITDTSNMQDIQTMNLIPQAWIVKVLTQHYQSLQAGGDMSMMKNFNTSAIRQGFILDDTPHYHSEILSLHGFHFELKAIHQKKGSYCFYMQRLKPGDPMLSFRQCERHTFSLRPDREVQYSIRVQYMDKQHQCHMNTTGMVSHTFGLGTKTSKSQVLTLDNLVAPIYVTFSILFPPS